MGDTLSWVWAWARNKTQSTKVRMHGRGGRCSFCKKPFGPHDVSRSVMTAGGGAREACNSCANAMGSRRLVNIIAHPPKPPKRKQGSGDSNYKGYG